MSNGGEFGDEEVGHGTRHSRRSRTVAEGGGGGGGVRRTSNLAFIINFGNSHTACHGAAGVVVRFPTGRLLFFILRFRVRAEATPRRRVGRGGEVTEEYKQNYPCRNARPRVVRKTVHNSFYAFGVTCAYVLLPFPRD